MPRGIIEIILMGAWERGPSLIDKIIRLNPFYANYVHFALRVNCLRQKNFAEAYHETLKLNRRELIKKVTFPVPGHF